jgi:hypothetical protein
MGEFKKDVDSDQWRQYVEVYKWVYYKWAEDKDL